MKRKIGIILVLVLCLLATACQNDLEVKDKKIIYDNEFGGFFIDISPDEFNSLGFTLGDSVDILLSNGSELIDIPYYNGYYTKINMPLICAYPGYVRIKVATNSGDDLFYLLELDETITATVKLNEKGKYSNVQEVMSMVYVNNREDFATDEEFANFRSLVGGNLKENIFYRSASPVDNTYNRAAYVDSLCEKVGIKYIVNLSENENEINGFFEKESFNSPYTKALYDNNKISLLDLSASFGSTNFRKGVANGLRDVIHNEGPYLMHCLEGKDRTGFVSMLIEALCDATYDEMLTDYMITYENYYHINESNEKSKYDAIVDTKFDDMLCYLAGVSSVKEIENIDLSLKAKEYLISGGMSEQEILELIDVLTK